MDKSNNIIENINYKDNIMYTLFIIILILVIFFFLIDVENINVQKHLNKVYKNNNFLKEKYKNLINDDYKLIKENNIIIVENILNPEYFNFLKNQFENKIFESKDKIVRKGTGYNFYDLNENDEYYGFVELFYTNNLLNFLSEIFDKPIQRTPLSDINACSLLIYTKKGDYIDWHKDYSNYYGDRYVVLLSIINENKDKNDLSENEFQYIYENKIYKLKLKENSAIIFKGSEIMHQSTPIGLSEKRILLSMTFCDICQEKKNIFYYIYEKSKNFMLY